MIYYLLGVITGLLLKEFLPADVINNYANRMKIKRSTVTESEIEQVSIPEPKKKGFRLFRKRKS